LYEDLEKSALVLYDARADWKLKADIILIRAEGKTVKGVRVKITGQDEAEREDVEEQRDERERQTKRNTQESSHRGNRTYDDLLVATISRKCKNPITRNNFRLFSIKAIRELILDIDKKLQCRRKQKVTVNDLLKYFPPTTQRRRLQQAP
jgi:hypothetical protein